VILVAGLTPAWQQILLFNQLTLGEVNRASEADWCASGKVLNVGLALAHLNVDSHTLSPVGGWTRVPIEQEFLRLGARATWVATTAPTRVCTTILDSGKAQTTELVQNAGALDDAELEEFRQRFMSLRSGASAIVLTGSLPRGTPSTIFAELLAGVSMPVVLDIRGPELLAALEYRPALVKPNREELEHTFSRPLSSTADVALAVQELIARGAQSVLMSQGKSPALLATSDGSWSFTPAPVERVVNPIGCGDCLAAGVAWGLSEGRPLIESVRFGMGAAADNLADRLPARLDRARVEKLASLVHVEPV
jgi:1-phosphofructokinase family hexose kinase